MHSSKGSSRDGSPSGPLKVRLLPPSKHGSPIASTTGVGTGPASLRQAAAAVQQQYRRQVSYCLVLVLAAVVVVNVVWMGQPQPEGGWLSGGAVAGPLAHLGRRAQRENRVQREDAGAQHANRSARSVGALEAIGDAAVTVAGFGGRSVLVGDAGGEVHAVPVTKRGAQRAGLISRVMRPRAGSTAGEGKGPDTSLVLRNNSWRTAPNGELDPDLVRPASMPATEQRHRDGSFTAARLASQQVSPWDKILALQDGGMEGENFPAGSPAHSSTKSPPAAPPEATADIVAAAASHIAEVGQSAKERAERRQSARSGKGRQKGRPITAILRPPEVATSSVDSCSQALQGTRVALLFLTKGELYHEPSWRLWFKSAAGLVPVSSLQDSVCAPNADLEALRGACASVEGDESSDDVITRQHLFSVYIHAPPVYKISGAMATDYPEGSLWRGHLIPHRIVPRWGDVSIVEATRNLLWEAYKDPLNARFVLISESGIPLYDPLTTYTQLMGEQRSRVEACRQKRAETHRMSWHMMGPNGLRRSQWRKSSQWFMLVRDHVRLVLEDEQLFRKFEEWCWNGWDQDYRRWRSCIADEHYIPTLLAGVHGLQDQMMCEGVGGVGAADWSMGGRHPKSYSPEEVVPELIWTARSWGAACNSTLVQERAQAQFVRTEETLLEAARNATCAALASSFHQQHLAPQPLMSQNCFLSARKFNQSTVEAVHRLFTDCGSGLRLLSDAVCAGMQQRPPAELASDGR